MFLRAKPPKTIRMHLCRDFNLLYVMLPNIRIPIPFFLAVRKYFILFGKAYQNLQQQFQWTKVICLKNRWFPKKYKIKSFSYLSSLSILNLTPKNCCFKICYCLNSILDIATMQCPRRGPALSMHIVNFSSKRAPISTHFFISTTNLYWLILVCCWHAD